MDAVTINQYQSKIQKLERELDEMTVALSHAWDQLVPFLQEVPIGANTARDIVPILKAVSAAADTQMAGLYLAKSGDWYALPDDTRLSDKFTSRLDSLTEETILRVSTRMGVESQWAFAPVFSEGDVIGALGVGTHDGDRKFTAVDLRIITRMADRIGSQVAAAQLARFREQESVREREMQIARQIQQSVLPPGAPQSERLQIAWHWQPAKEVGGDAWGWVQRGDHWIAWFVLDVAGKGLPAALAAVALHTAVSMTLKLRPSVVDVVRIVNEHLYDAYTRSDLMATLAVLSLDLNTGALEIANAGHPPVLVRHQGQWLRLAATAPPIGVLPSLHAEPQVVMLQPYDTMICYSDGLTEIQQESRLWGQTGLLKTIPNGAKNVQALTKHIISASKWAGAIEDDLTLVTAIYMDG